MKKICVVMLTVSSLMAGDPAVDKAAEELEKKAVISGKEPASSSRVKFPLVYVAPGIKQVLINFVREEQAGVRGAQYRLTLYSVAEALTQQKIEKEISVARVVDKK